MQRILYIAFFLASFNVNAQQFFFKTWNSNNGLIVSDINAIAQDSVGFLWLATEGGGLARFDGKDFVNLTVEDGLPSDFVTALFWDKNKLFIGTEKGVCVYNGISFTLLDSVPGFESARVHSFAKSGDQFFVAYKRKVQEFNFNFFKTLRPSFFNGQRVTSLHVSDENLMVTCDSGLVAYHLESKTWSKKDTNEQAVFYCQSQDLKTEILATRSTAYLKVNGAKTVLDLDRVKSATAINNSDLVIGYKKGFAIIRNGLPTYYGRKNGLKADLVKALFVDRYHNIWVGCSNGLFKFVNPAISTITQKDGLIGEHVHAILEDQNRIWFGTNDGIEYFENNQFFLVDEIEQGLVFKIVKDKEGIVWFATEMGLIKYKDGVFTDINKFNTIEQSFVFDVVPSRKGGLYIATGNSVYYYFKDKVTDLFKGMPLPINGASKILEGEDGALWIYRIDGALARYQSGSVNVFSNLGDLVLTDFRVNSFITLSERELVIATAENGLIYWDGFKAKMIDENDGLYSDKVLGVQAIGDNKVVILSEEGIQILDNNNGISLDRYIGEEDGFRANESIVDAMQLSENDILWVGTKTGVVRVDLELLLKQEQEFTPIITAVELFFNKTNWTELDKTIKPWVSIPAKLELAYAQNYLTFKFNALTSNDPHLLKFRYKLKGQDANWTFVENRFEAIFTDISPGRYTFLLEVSNTNDFTNAKQLEYHIKIVPPFWKTIWFWALLILIVGVIVFLMVRERIVQLNKKIELETALSESERKALRLQMNPHFIFNALDSISGFIFKNEPKNAVKYLNNFAKLMRLTLETSREVLIPLETELNLIIYPVSHSWSDYLY